MWHVDDLDLRGEWRPRAWLLDPTTDLERELLVTGGSLERDETDPHEVTARVTVAELTGIPPTRLGQDLMPDGREIRVVAVGTRTGVEVPLLVGPITKTSWSRSATRAGDVEVEVRPRSWRVSLARWEAPQVVPSGVPLDTLIHLLVASRAPAVPRIVADDPRTLSRTLWWGEDTDNDPWVDLRRLARSQSMRLFADRRGAIRWEAPREHPVVEIGGDLLPIVEASAELDSERVYSGVVAFNTSQKGPAVRVTVWDTDPLSPTRIDGPFGRKPLFWGSPLFRDAEHAEASARSRLQRVRRQLVHATVTCRVHPGLDLTDVVRLTVPGDPLLSDLVRWSVDRIRWDFGDARMTVELSARIGVLDE